MAYQVSIGEIQRSIDYADAIYWLDIDPAKSLAILRRSHHDLPCENGEADVANVNPDLVG